MPDEFASVDLFADRKPVPGPGPDTVTLRVCERCGRTDRDMALNRWGGHYSNGEKCRGRVVDVIYRRAAA